MKQTAKVIETDGKYAVAEVTRSSMCDGCHKKDCGGQTCAAGTIMGAHKTMTVRVRNPIGAEAGDRVIIETEDKTVLAYAALVFLMPILVSGILYAVFTRITTLTWVPVLAAAVGFAGAFAVLGLVEQKKKREESDIVIREILRGETE